MSSTLELELPVRDPTEDSKNQLTRKFDISGRFMVETSDQGISST